MRKFIGLMAAMGLLVFSLAGVASAGSNLPNGTLITGTSSGVSLGGFITCNSTVTGDITNKPAGQGIHAVLTTATFSPCAPSGTSASSTALPWTLNTTGTTNGGATWDGTVTGVNVDLFVFFQNCHYTGSVGALYENSTHVLTLSGSLSSSTGGLCPSTGAVSGNYSVSPALTLN